MNINEIPADILEYIALVTKDVEIWYKLALTCINFGRHTLKVEVQKRAGEKFYKQTYEILDENRTFSIYKGYKLLLKIKTDFMPCSDYQYIDCVNNHIYNWNKFCKEFIIETYMSVGKFRLKISKPGSQEFRKLECMQHNAVDHNFPMFSAYSNFYKSEYNIGSNGRMMDKITKKCALRNPYEEYKSYIHHEIPSLKVGAYLDLSAWGFHPIDQLTWDSLAYIQTECETYLPKGFFQ